MLPKSTITQFLQKPRDDFRPWKKLSPEDCQARADKLVARPPIWDKFRHHQKICFLIGAKTCRFAFWLDTGCGKTLLSIALARYFKRASIVKRVLVLVPNKINCDEWSDEIVKHCPNVKYKILRGSSRQKWQQLEQSPDALLTMTTYAGLARMVCELVTIKKGKHKGENKLKPIAKLVKRITDTFDGLVMDESTEVQSKGRLPFRICRKIAAASQITFALSGTPFGRDPTPLWSQMFLIDGGETLGKNLGIFRAAFFKEKENYWSAYPDYVFDERKKGLLNRLLAHRSIRYPANKADLPKVVPIIKQVRLSDEPRVFYDRARDRLIASHGNFREQKNAFLRMRQISSGFLGYYDDELGVKAQQEFFPNPKLESLLATIASIRLDHKILVMHDFVFSGAMISRELTTMKIKHVRIYGKTKNPGEVLKQFKTDPKTQVCVMNQAGAFGLNLQVAKYGLIYESLVPVIKRKQIIARFVRQESEHETVFLIDYVTRGTVDQQILDFHAQGKSLFDAIIEGSAKPI
jgi:SNF2 family DNA or RNA helicase